MSFSEEQIDALEQFEEEVDGFIVTFKMTEEEREELGEKILEWKKNPTPESTQEIVDKFVSDAPPGVEL